MIDVRSKLKKQALKLTQAAAELRNIAERDPAPHLRTLLRIAEEVERGVNDSIDVIDAVDREEAEIAADTAAYMAIRANERNG